MKSLKLALLSIPVALYTVTTCAKTLAQDEYIAAEITTPIVQILATTNLYAFLAERIAQANPLEDLQFEFHRTCDNDERSAISELITIKEIGCAKPGVTYESVIQNTPVSLREKVFFALFKLFIKETDKKTPLKSFINLFCAFMKDTKGNYLPGYKAFCETLLKHVGLSKPTQTAAFLKQVDNAVNTLPDHVAEKIRGTVKTADVGKLASTLNTRIKLNA